MKLLDETIATIKALRADGIALAAITVEEAGERVQIRIGSLETRDIYDHKRDSRDEPNEEMLDTYHET